MPVKASPGEWQIAPSTCFTNKPGEPCRLQIRVALPAKLSNTQQEVCFYLNEQLLKCLRSNTAEVLVPVTLTENAELQIKVDGNKKAVQKLLVQSLEPNKRRRVKSPWSFF